VRRSRRGGLHEDRDLRAGEGGVTAGTARARRRRWLRDQDRTDMDQKLLDILVCPVTKGPLTLDRERQELVSRAARLAYPIRDGIPVMLEDEARKLAPDESE
jgi:uncharacterized protein YbaR (Trm112 family)